MAEGKARGSGSKAPPSRRLVAIMFTDLVGYSALAHRDEQLAIELLELHRGWVRAILPQFGGNEIETVGDAFLIEFAGALAAVECAVAIQRRFAEHNAAAPPDRRMELRIGIHLGDVEHRADKVFGDGVNIASRIHGMARPGGICVSEDVQHAVRNRPAFQFTSLGSPPLKNITAPLELFELAPSLSLAPPADVQVARAPPAKPSRPWLPVAAAALGAVAVFAVAGAWLATRAPHSTIPAIAVLPFENLSSDQDSAFFTDGLHDTVIGHLSRVSGIKVISRTSVMGYRGQKANLRQIASELGVTSILEGSVQRAGTKLRVAAQLIDTSSDTHLWSSEYNRELKDVFEVQADIAQQVATAVRVQLTPQEQASIHAVPTRNAAAYDLYLRAVLIERSSERLSRRLKEAIGWLDQAIALDAGFARAYALRSMVGDTLWWFGHDPSDERKRQAAEDADRSLQLDPSLVEGHIAKAQHLYHGSRDYEAALHELEKARSGAPGNATVHSRVAWIYRRQGRWDEAVASLERAVALDPLNPTMVADYAETLQMLRRYGDVDSLNERLLSIEASPFTEVPAAYNHFLQDGNLKPVTLALTRLPPDTEPCDVFFWRMGTALLERRFDVAAAAVDSCKNEMVNGGASEQVPREYFVALVQWYANERKRPAAGAKARARLEAMLAERADQPGVRMNLAFTLAMLGERQRALEEADRALAALPLSRDALTGVALLRVASEVHANAGALDRAFAELGQLLRLPGGVALEELKRDPVYDPLRSDPRYQRLLDGAVAKRT